MRPAALVTAGAAALLLSGVAAAKPISFLALRAGECAVRATPSAKTVEVVPCSSPHHNLEVYAVKHGGWGKGAIPSASLASARAEYLCLNAFVDVTGHRLPATYGWRGFWPDAGAEQARYGDEVICSLSHFPALSALGSGRHL